MRHRLSHSCNPPNLVDTGFFRCRIPAMASPGQESESKHLLGTVDPIPSLIHTGRVGSISTTSTNSGSSNHTEKYYAEPCTANRSLSITPIAASSRRSVSRLQIHPPKGDGGECEIVAARHHDSTNEPVPFVIPIAIFFVASLSLVRQHRGILARPF